MKFAELCRVSKQVAITAIVRRGDKVAYFPESFKRGEFGQKVFDLKGITWLTNNKCKSFHNLYVTHIEPTSHNTMNVTLVETLYNKVS